MHKYFIFYFFLLFFSTSSSAQDVAKENAQNTLNKSKSFFQENKGQWDSHAKFLMHSGGMNIWITTDA